MKSHNTEVLKLQESIFSTITQKALQENAINLAQGFPDFEGPEWVIKLAQEAFLQGRNQYAPSMGALTLRQAIADLYQRHYQLSFDPQQEILITHGATEAIYCTVRALINPGDEVIVFEPLYDSYAASVQMARGVLKPVTLRAPEFMFSEDEVRSQISEKTKLMILNNPHNPTGRVFSRGEVQFLLELADKHDFYILSDEVYEFLCFEGKHHPTAQWAIQRDRVITVSSIGKTLSFTGWKIGWVCGAASIIRSIHNVHQFVNFCANHPLQWALSQALPKMDDYLIEFRQDYERKRDLLYNGLSELGYNLMKPQGTYFLLAEVPPGLNSLDFCYQLIGEKKVATIPLSPFYLKSKEGGHLVRFCFAKKDETLQQALRHLGLQV